jgi:dipeptidyl aminopeptidase/acylaminoacyl peptidase
MPVAHGNPIFSTDGAGFFVTSDAGTEFRKLVYVDLETGKQTAISGDIDWDVSSFDVSDDGRQLAYSTNEAGSSALYLFNTETGSSRRVESLPTGVMGSPHWHNDGEHLAVSISSARTPGDVFVLNTSSSELVRWTYSETGEVDTTLLPEPELIKWQSFDGREISAFYYRPEEKFEGKRPVVVNIHGGPEGQSRPRYLGRWNYFLNELGIAIIYPNVRGSAGFGKTYLKLDNGMLREGGPHDAGGRDPLRRPDRLFHQPLWPVQPADVSRKYARVSA